MLSADLLIERLWQLLKIHRKSFEGRLTVCPHFIEYITGAFSHPLLLDQHPSADKVKEFQRLEFLGDSVIELEVTRRLYHLSPKASEGKLTSWRSSIVQAGALAAAVKQLGLVTEAEAAELEPSTDRVLSSMLESICGAFFLSLGYEFCQKFLAMFLDDLITNIQQGSPEHINYVDKLVNELPPVRRKYLSFLIEEDSDSGFICRVMLDKVELGRSCGRNKKEARSSAAKLALLIISGVKA